MVFCVTATFQLFEAIHEWPDTGHNYHIPKFCKNKWSIRLRCKAGIWILDMYCKKAEKPQSSILFAVPQPNCSESHSAKIDYYQSNSHPNVVHLENVTGKQLTLLIHFVR